MYELKVDWAAGEEEHVTFLMKGDDFADLKQKAREFLALISAERLKYNKKVMQPLLDKRDELEAALVAKQRELAALTALPPGAPLTT